MSTMSLLALAAGTWGVLMSLAPLLQIRAMVRAGSSDGVSLGYLRVLLVGFVLWLAYGLSRGDAPLVVCNGLAATVGAASLLVASRLRTHAAAPAVPGDVHGTDESAPVAASTS